MIRRRTAELREQSNPRFDVRCGSLANFTVLSIPLLVTVLLKAHAKCR